MSGRERGRLSGHVEIFTGYFRVSTNTSACTAKLTTSNDERQKKRKVAHDYLSLTCFFFPYLFSICSKSRSLVSAAECRDSSLDSTHTHTCARVVLVSPLNDTLPREITLSKGCCVFFLRFSQHLCCCTQQHRLWRIQGARIEVVEIYERQKHRGMASRAGVIVGSMISQPTRSVVQVAQLLGLPVTLRQVQKGELYTQDFREKNPNLKMPVLQMDNGFTLYESTSIARYLCNSARQQRGERGAGVDVEEAATVDPEQLLPTNVEARAKVDSLLDWHHCFLRPGATGTVRRLVMQHFLPAEHSGHVEIQQTAPERDARLLAHSLQVMEDILTTQRHGFFGTAGCASGDFSLVDIFFYHEVVQLDLLVPHPHLNGNLHGAHPQISAWLDRMREVPFASEITKTLTEFAVANGDFIEQVGGAPT